MKSNRNDMREYLIHWCKSDSRNYEEAFQCLLDIIISEKIAGNSNLIKGNHKVICFSEAPIEVVLSHQHGRYLPFGITFLKSTIFAKGGRPVIYQAPEEYYDLPTSLQWRHVSYNPLGDKKCDFTWEREWRIKSDELELNPNEMLIVLPNMQWKNKLIENYIEHHSTKNYMYEMLMGAGCGCFPEESQYCIMNLS